MNPQYGTITGSREMTPAADYTGKEAHLCKVNSSGAVVTTTGDTDAAIFVIVKGGTVAEKVEVLPVKGPYDISLKVSADVAAGALLEIDTSNAGQVKTKNSGTAKFVALAAVSAGSFVKAIAL